MKLIKSVIKGLLKYPVMFINNIFLYLYFKYYKKQEYIVDEQFSKNSKVLFIAPHVDDETIGAGATLIKHVESNDSVTCIYIADGAGAVSDLTKKDLVERRKKEARDVKEIIGIEKLYFLEIPDGEVLVKDTFVDKVNEILQKENPNIIYTPFLIDGHIDHVNSTRIVMKAIKKWDENFKDLYMYSVNTPIRPDIINRVTLIDKTLFDKKNSLYEVFKSQYVMGFGAFKLVDRMRRILINRGYALEGFIKVDIDKAIEFDNKLKIYKFEASMFRQLSSSYNLLCSFMRNKKKKKKYINDFKNITIKKKINIKKLTN